ncbi:amino acid adenylation domain-containing protein [Streptomyces sp. NPDC021093]|uniref:amino acid adenylation domain-containing protein n=1 Tax=Streptomyces sp. NPDC021093 TaxID=3365112 RepID=UPI0037B1D933
MIAGSVHESFRAQAMRTPDAEAVRCAGRSLTYRELEERSNRLAHRLVAEGAGPERPVLVLTDRSVELVVGLLAILKSGSFYLPLHTAFPQDRMQWMAGESRAPVLLADTTMQGRWLPEVPATVLVDRPEEFAHHPATAPEVPAAPDQLAYVMYTSGSTGLPKGVAISHQGILDLVADSMFTVPGAHDRVLLVASYAFDPSTYSFWYPLLHGGTVVVAAEDELTVDRLARLFGQERITGVDITAGLFRVIAEERPECFRGVREIITGGDVNSPTAVRRALDACPGLTVRCAYGPTETTLFATQAPWRESAAVPEPVPIGRPLDGMGGYVLDDRLRKAATGETGELYMAGPGLARGYFNRPALSAERFVADPFGPPGTRMYRTGDLARWNADGLIEFAGRVDNQVKIRGFRIEPGEVEATLAAFPGLRQAAVAVREDRPGDKRLVGYVVPDEGVAVDLGAVRAHLSERLPAYMVPSAVVVIDELPLTPNHKVDHRALPAPPTERQDGRGPRDERERLLCGLVADVLDAPGTGIDDDFFALGGHSLHATRLISRIRAAFDIDLGVAAVFAHPTVAALAEAVGRAPAARPALRALPRPDRVPLSAAQYRLWFLGQLEGRSATYSLPIAIRLRGPLDTGALEAALGDVLARHEGLRTVFPEVDGEPCQVVLSPERAHPALPVEQVADLAATLRAAGREPFDPTTELPLRARLFAEGDDAHTLLLTMNHIGSDGWSMEPLTRDLREAYTARLDGAAPDRSPLPVQYADYALWQRELLGAEDDPESLSSRQLAYWRTALEGVPEELELPLDRPRPTVSGHEGGVVPVRIGAALHDAIVKLTRTTRTTVFMVLQAAVAGLLTRLGAGTDIPVGSTIAGRTDAALDDLVGFFVNTLVLRTDTSGDPAFTELLERVRETDLAAYEHQDVPFERVVEALNPARTPGRHPLFQVMLVLENPGGYRFSLPGVTADSKELFTGTAKFDLLFSFTEEYAADGTPLGITGRLEYDTGLCDPATAALLGERLERLLADAVRAPERALSEADLFLDGERERVLTGWNATGAALPLPATVTERFEEQAARTPQAPAVVADGVRLSYAALNARANRLAHELTDRGAGPETLVGLCLPRGADMITAILAVWKTGAAYLPVDPAEPAGRTAFQLADSGVRLLVGTRASLAALPEDGTPWLVLDDETVAVSLAGRPDTGPGTAVAPGTGAAPRTAVAPGTKTAPRTAVAPGQLAYVIYTSGSTGRPKGVAVTHGSLANYTDAVPGRIGVGESGGRYALLQPQVTDLGNTMVFASLATGGELHILDAGAITDPDAVAAYLKDHRIDYLKAVPSHLAALSAGGGTARVLPAKSLVLGGEAADPAWTRELIAAADDRGLRGLFNHYGPTETTIGVTTAPLPRQVRDGAAIPVGAPIARTRLYVLDPWLRPVPPGTTGELYVAGAALARGYVGRPGLTAASFVACPFESGQRMYRTGDLARWNAEGQVVLAGRADDQVKVRGFRIEPGEVRAALAEHPGVAQLAVVAREDVPGDVRLVAYAVPALAGDGQLAAGLREFAARRLPERMLPSAVVVLDRLPLTPNGKLDRKALPAPDRTADPAAGRGPVTRGEQRLCELFAEVLGLDAVGVDDDFFALGGHSLLATRLVGRIRAELDGALPVRTLFAAPTAARLAARLGRGGQHERQDSLGVLLPLREQGTRRPLFCVHPAIGLGWCYSGLLTHLDGDQPVYGLQARAFTEPEAAPQDFDALVADYLAEIRAVQPHGPYALLGWSFGGTAAHALAVRLREDGEEVDFLGVLDGYPTRDDWRREPLAHDDPKVWAEIAESVGHDPSAPGSPLAVALGPAGLAALPRVFTGVSRLREGTVTGVLDGSMVFFGAAAGRPERFTPDLWTPHVTGGVEVHEIDCAHGAMTGPTALAVVGPVVAKHLGRRSRQSE